MRYAFSLIYIYITSFVCMCVQNGLNALHLAAKDGHLEIVADLLKLGATVDAATKKGNTALHIASLGKFGFFQHVHNIVTSMCRNLT
jgi:ankyrin